MKTRFPKFWCGACNMMRFEGDCSHRRSVDGRDFREPFVAAMLRMTSADLWGEYARSQMQRWRDLVLPPVTKWKLYPASEILNDNAFALAAGPE